MARYKEILKESLENTTTHGVPHIVRNGSLLIRAMWLVLFLGSLSYCTYTIIKSIIQYSSYDTTVQINLIRESPTEFPAVTICNINPYSNVINFDNSLRPGGNSGGNRSLDWTNSSNKSPQLQFNDVYDKIKRQVAQQSIDSKVRLGYSLKNDLLISCIFNKEECGADNFTTFWSDDYGNCFTFNGLNRFLNNTIRQTSRAGSNFGLTLEVTTGYTEKEPPYSIKKGMFLVVHNRTSTPSILNQGIDISPGYHTYVSVSRSSVKKMPQPYSDCIESLEKYKVATSATKSMYEIMKNFSPTEYDQEFCYQLCLQQLYIRKCNCCEINIPTLENKTYCVEDSEIDCLDSVTQSVSGTNLDLLCNLSCPVRCQYTTYQLSTHTAVYPTQYYLSNLMSTAQAQYSQNGYQAYIYLLNKYNSIKNSTDNTATTMQKYMIRITVNYNDLSYTLQEDVPSMTLETLFGILGGQLGLFIGMSFLSFVEIFDLFLRYLILIISSKRKKEKTQETLVSSVHNSHLHFYNNSSLYI